MIENPRFYFVEQKYKIGINANKLIKYKVHKVHKV